MLYIIILYTIISSSFDLVYVNANPDSYYAGYYYYSIAGSDRWGVEGKIYTADMYNIPYGSGGAEWISVILSYNPFYWIQVGYVKEWYYGWSPSIEYYIEKNDRYGYNITYYQGPEIGSVHLYRIINENAYSDPSNPIDPHLWIIKVDPEDQCPPVSREIYIDLYIGKDLQVFIEIKDQNIIVAASHLYNLKYYDPYYGWLLWDRHVPYHDFMFVLEEVSDHEFYAWT